MDLIKATKEAFFKAIDRVGGRLVRLQEKTGVSYPVINQLNSGKKNFKDLSLQTVEKLFPELEVYFFHDEHRVVTPAGLSPGAKKIIEIYNSLSEEDQVDFLVSAAAFRERRSKNVSEKVSKAG